MYNAQVIEQLPGMGNTPTLQPSIGRDDFTVERSEFIILAARILSPEGKKRVFADFAKSGLLSDAFNGFNDLIGLLMFRDYDEFCRSLHCNIGYVTEYRERVLDFIEKQIAGDNIATGIPQEDVEHFKARLLKYIYSIGGTAVAEFTRIVTEINTLVGELQIKAIGEAGLSEAEFEVGFSKLYKLLFTDVRNLQQMELIG